MSSVSLCSVIWIAGEFLRSPKLQVVFLSGSPAAEQDILLTHLSRKHRSAYGIGSIVLSTKMSSFSLVSCLVSRLETFLVVGHLATCWIILSLSSRHICKSVLLCFSLDCCITFTSSKGKSHRWDNKSFNDFIRSWTGLMPSRAQASKERGLVKTYLLFSASAESKLFKSKWGGGEDDLNSPILKVYLRYRPKRCTEGSVTSSEWRGQEGISLSMWPVHDASPHEWRERNSAKTNHKSL